MDKQEILDGNILIGAFAFKDTVWKEMPFSAELADYHSNWHSLMPVLEKLCKTELVYGNVDEKYTKYPRTFGMIDEQGNFMVRLNCAPLFTAPTLIQATWLAVVDFLKPETQIDL